MLESKRKSAMKHRQHVTKLLLLMTVLAMGKAPLTRKAPCPYIWVIVQGYWHRSEGVTASAPFLSFVHVLFGWFLFCTVPDHPFVLDNKWKRIQNVSYCKLLH